MIDTQKNSGEVTQGNDLQILKETIEISFKPKKHLKENAHARASRGYKLATGESVRFGRGDAVNLSRGPTEMKETRIL